MDFQVAKFLLDVIAIVVLPATGYLIVRTLKQIDANQRELAINLGKLWDHHSDLSDEFHELKGAVGEYHRRAEDKK